MGSALCLLWLSALSGSRDAGGESGHVLLQQPGGHLPGGQAVVAVVGEDPPQLVAAARSGASPQPPLAPPQQAAGAVDTALAPAETAPAGHRLEAVAVHRQQPVLAQALMHIDQALPELLALRLTGPLAFGQAQQVDRFGLAVVQHRPVRVARQQGAQPLPQPRLAVFVQRQQRVKAAAGWPLW